MFANYSKIINIVLNTCNAHCFKTRHYIFTMTFISCNVRCCYSNGGGGATIGL